MNWEALGAIGEIAGAVAVVVTLGYLAVQIRQNTDSLRAATMQDIVREGNVFVRDLALHPDLAQVWRSGLDSLETLSSEEREQFHFLMLSLYRRVENTYHQSRRRLMHESDVAGFLTSSFYALARPGAREWWESNAFRFSPLMQEYVRQKLAETATAEAGEPPAH